MSLITRTPRYLEELLYEESKSRDPLLILLNYLAQTRDFTFDMEGTMISGLFAIGSMGCGKSTWARSLIARVLVPLNWADGVDDSQIAVVHSFKATVDEICPLIGKDLDLSKLKHLYFVQDDIAASMGGNARESLKSLNVLAGKYYIMIRHNLEDMGFTGKLTNITISQIFHLADKTLRIGLKVKAFKDYPEELADKEDAAEYLGYRGLAELGNLSRKIWSPQDAKEKLEGLETAEVRFLNYPPIPFRIERANVLGNMLHVYGDKEVLEKEKQKQEEFELYKQFKAESLAKARAIVDSVRVPKSPEWKCWNCGKVWNISRNDDPTKRIRLRCPICRKDQGTISGVKPDRKMGRPKKKVEGAENGKGESIL